MNTRKTIFVSVLVVLLIGLGAWWYSGYSLDFMRFFAAEPGVTDTTGTATDTTIAGIRQPVPSGCQLRQVQCIQAPCPPIVECPRVSCMAEKTTVIAGTLINIQAYGGTGGYAFAAPEGTLAMYDQNTTGGTIDKVGVAYDTPGIKQVLVTSKRATDTTLTDVAACPITVIPAAIGNY